MFYMCKIAGKAAHFVQSTVLFASSLYHPEQEKELSSMRLLISFRKVLSSLILRMNYETLKIK